MAGSVYPSQQQKTVPASNNPRIDNDTDIPASNDPDKPIDFKPNTPDDIQYALVRSDEEIMSLKAQSEAAPEHVRAQIKAARQSEATKEQAQTQSHADREENFQIALNLVGAKIQNDPSSVTKEDAAYLQSRESRASESGYVEKDSISAEIQRLADANEKTGSGTVLESV